MKTEKLQTLIKSRVPLVPHVPPPENPHCISLLSETQVGQMQKMDVSHLSHLWLQPGQVGHVGTNAKILICPSPVPPKPLFYKPFREGGQQGQVGHAKNQYIEKLSLISLIRYSCPATEWEVNSRRNLVFLLDALWIPAFAGMTGLLRCCNTIRMFSSTSAPLCPTRILLVKTQRGDFYHSKEHIL